MKNLDYKPLILIGFLLLTYFSYAQKNKLLTPIKETDNWETWYDKVPVSGEIRVGLLYDFNESKVNYESFFVDLPESKNNILCVQVNSIDGRYSGKLEYNIQDLEAGSHEVKWPSVFSEDLKKYAINELSILTEFNCDDETSNYVISSWDRNNTDTVYVLLNVDKRVHIAIKDKDHNTTEKITCQDLDELITVTYNCICKIPVDKIPQNAEVLIRQRVRKPGRISYNEYPFNILK